MTDINSYRMEMNNYRIEIFNYIKEKIIEQGYTIKRSFIEEIGKNHFLYFIEANGYAITLFYSCKNDYILFESVHVYPNNQEYSIVEQDIDETYDQEKIWEICSPYFTPSNYS